MRQRDLKFTFVVGEGKLAFDVVEFELEEALCEPFRLNLKLASDKNAIDFRQVLDQPGTFTLWQDGRPARYVHGIVSHFTQGSSGFRRTRYELLLEPQLARLELCCNWRIFQEKSVPEILQALLKEHRVLDYEQRIYHEHLPTWKTCTSPTARSPGPTKSPAPPAPTTGAPRSPAEPRPPHAASLAGRRALDDP